MTRLQNPEPETSARAESQSRWSHLVWGVVLPVVFIVGIGWFVWNERAMLGQIREAPSGSLVLIAFLFAVGHLLNSTEFWILYRASGTRFGFLENWMLFTGGQLANHLPAQLGTVYRIQYMRSVHGASYTESAAVYGANLVITVWASAFVGLVGVMGSAAGPRSISMTMLLVFVCMGLFASVLAVVPLPSFPNRSGRLAGLWRRLHTGFKEIRRVPSTALGVVVLESVKYVVTAWRIQVTFALVGIREPIWLFLVLAPAASIAGFIALTPGALGFREAFVTGAAGAMDLEFADGLLGATVDRAAMLATVLLLGSIGLLMTYPRFRAASVPDTANDAKGAGPDERA